MKRMKIVGAACIALLAALSMTACDKKAEEASIESQAEQTEVKAETVAKVDTTMGVIVALVPEKETGDFYTVVFNDVRIRETPALDGKILATVQYGAKLEIVDGDAISENTNSVVLRGVRYSANWYMIKAPGGQTGWIYGAAIGRYLTATKA